MQNKTTQKIIIDATKLETLLRLGCSEKAISDYIFYNKFTKQDDRLINTLLESLLDRRDFKNWGGNHNPLGKNQHTNKQLGQVDQQVVLGQVGGQVVDKDKDKDKDIDKDIDNLKTNKEIVIDYDSFMERWNRSASRHDNMIAINLMNDDRKKKLEARFRDLKKNGKEPTIENFFKIIGTAYQNSEFLQGEKTGFNFTLDFVLQAKSFQKILENGYRDK